MTNYDFDYMYNSRILVRFYSGFYSMFSMFSISEMKKFQNACTVLIGPANLHDLSEPVVYQHIQLSTKFRVHFQKKNGEEELEDSFAG